MPNIDIKGIAVGLIALTAAIVVLGITFPVVIAPTCDNAHTPYIVKKILCWLG